MGGDIMENKQELIVAADTKQIPVISEFIADLMATSGFDLKKIFEVQLAAEEACTNIALYAYRGGGGSIHIIALVREDRLELIIADEGMPFDPTSRIISISTADVEQRPIGGLGIALIKSAVDGISYEFKDGKNILRLIKNKN